MKQGLEQNPCFETADFFHFICTADSIHCIRLILKQTETLRNKNRNLFQHAFRQQPALISSSRVTKKSKPHIITVPCAEI